MEKIRPDKKNSSYNHRIFFKTDMPFRRGWSKAIGFEEPKDKVICLQNVIVRLRTGAYTPDGGYDSNGNWVDPTQSIVFYHNNPNKDIICTIADDSFEMNYNNFPHQRFWRWLEYFCNDCKKGKTQNELLKTHLYFNFEKLYSVDEPRFLTKTACRTWCDLKKKEGHDPDDVETFYDLFCKRWFSEADQIDLDELDRQKKMKLGIKSR